MTILRILVFVLFVLAGFFVALFFVRFFSERQLDDVNPLIPCEDSLLDKADVYYVIPLYKNEPISSYDLWCDKIKSKGKRVAMHGVHHYYKEFGAKADANYVQEGVDEFEKCFGFPPDEFKPPQLAWTNENNWMKKEFRVVGFWNQLFHKVYHCGDTGRFPNWFIDLF